MSRVTTFSRNFPAKHPRKGEKTNFPEQILRSLSIPDYWNWFDKANEGIDTYEFRTNFYYPESGIKYHTVRAGNRWKVGDWLSPRVWSGLPYRSKQIIIAPDIEIKKIWKFSNDEKGRMFANDVLINPYFCDIAKNDGLSLHDFLDWFPPEKVFSGQILCWHEKIEYP